MSTPHVLPDRCIGSGLCEMAAPATFEVGDDGTSTVVDPDGDDTDVIEAAITGCPAQAIEMA